MSPASNANFRAGATLALLTAVGCAAPSRYVASVPPAQGARIRVSTILGRAQAGRNIRVLLDIYDFDNGCPDACVRLQKNGYRGSVTMVDEPAGVGVRLAAARSGAVADRVVPSESNDPVTVPAGKRLVLRATFTSAAYGKDEACGPTVSFVPEVGRDYVYVFIAPMYAGEACVARVRQREPENGPSRLGHVPTLTALNAGEAGCNSARMCLLKEPSRPSAATPIAAAPSPPPVASPEPGSPKSPLSSQAFRAEMTRPQFLYAPAPVYTREAARARVEGMALVKCVLTLQSTLENCRILRGLPFMDEAILETLAKWRTAGPVLFKGKPVAVEYVIPIRILVPDVLRGPGRRELPLTDEDLFDLR